MDVKLVAAIVLVSIVAAFTLGILFGQSHSPSQKNGLAQAECSVAGLKGENITVVGGSEYDTNLTDVIHVRDVKDIDDRRERLIRTVWKGAFPSDKMPTSVDIDYYDGRYYELINNFSDNLGRIDRINVSMEYGVDSIAYHFHPLHGNNKLVIYQRGHEGDFIFGADTIKFFLDRNYSVIAFCMPLDGMNSRPVVRTESFGDVRLKNHDSLPMLESDSFTPMKYFLEPLAVTLNYVGKNFNYDSVSMIGLSGGGWTTTVYSAIDPRISRSYPVAGSLPNHMREEWGDWEQGYLPILRIADYLDMYVMGSYGKGRKQMQILNSKDACCFKGETYEKQPYEADINRRLSSLGSGEFRVRIENYSGHAITDSALQAVYLDMEKNPAANTG
jgi:hypothetical protein